MKRDADLDAFLAEVLAEHLAAMRAELIELVGKAIAAKPLPPFVPPPAWAEGKHYAASCCVRHRGGLFYALRDTEDQPPSDAWVPLIVGLSGIDLRWLDDGHKFMAFAQLSDGRVIEHQCEIAVPIVRGYWNAETLYYPGDRVFRYGEHHCIKQCMSIDPTAPDGGEHWEKVGGKHARPVTFQLDEETGELSENGRSVGNVRKVFEKVVAVALAKHAA